jgi:hypothetical protein
MTTAFPGAPRLIKGALVALDPAQPGTRTILFQYNPEQVTRSLTPYAFGNQGDRGEALRLKGPPRETMSVAIELDATDQLEQGTEPTASLGLHPVLALLEILISPPYKLAIANSVLASLGMLEIVPASAPLTLFVWGKARVVPVRITSVSLTEEEFDTELNPIRAKATLALQVLTYEDLGIATPGGAISLAGQAVKESFATLGSIQSMRDALNLKIG